MTESAPYFPVGTIPVDQEQIWVCDGFFARRCRWAAVDKTDSNAGPQGPAANCFLTPLCLLVTSELN